MIFLWLHKINVMTISIEGSHDFVKKNTIPFTGFMSTGKMRHRIFCMNDLKDGNDRTNAVFQANAAE